MFILVPITRFFLPTSKQKRNHPAIAGKTILPHFYIHPPIGGFFLPFFISVQSNQQIRDIL